MFLASQPAAGDFELAKNGGVKTVINLRHPSENKDFDEKAVVQGLGLTYISIPWAGVDELTDQRLDEMRQALKTAERPVLFHCSSANRAGAGWLAYRVLDEGLSVEAAREEAKVVGLGSPNIEARTLEYIAARQ